MANQVGRFPARSRKAALLLILCGAPLGCSARHGAGDSGGERAEPVALPSDCQAYAASYERQLTAATPSSSAVARELADQTRASLRAEAERIGADALAAKCRMNLQRIAAPTAASSH